MPFVDDQGVRLWYQITGKGNPLVVSGGFGLLDNQYDYVRDALAKEFQVIDWNYRGVGQSDRAWPGGSFNLDRWVDDLELILDNLGLRDVNLWGTSTGSQITMRYVARYQARVRSMITYPMVKADVGFRNAFKGFQYVCETFGYDALAALTSWIGCAEENVFGPKWGEVAKYEAEAFKQNFTIESLNETMAIHANSDLTADLAKIKVRTMLLLGESGNLGFGSPGIKDLADEFMQHVPHAHLQIIAGGGGTYCMIEKPEETAAAVIEFVKDG